MAFIKKDEDKHYKAPDNNNGNGGDDDDDFGLPEVNFDPVNRKEEPGTPKEEAPKPEAAATKKEVIDQHRTTKPKDDNNEGKPVYGPIVTALVVIVVLAGIAVWLLFGGGLDMFKKKEVAKKDPPPKVVKKPAPKPVKKEVVVNPEPAAGIDTIGYGTGRYYVVVGSFIDDDVALDFCKQIEASGKRAIVLDPSGTVSKYYRVAVGKDYATEQEAKDAAKALAGQYGSDPYPKKY